jgi:hypothetical protein
MTLIQISWQSHLPGKSSPRQKKNSLMVEQNLAGRIMVVLSDPKIIPTLTVVSLQPF